MRPMWFIKAKGVGPGSIKFKFRFQCFFGFLALTHSLFCVALYHGLSIQRLASYPYSALVFVTGYFEFMGYHGLLESR